MFCLEHEGNKSKEAATTDFVFLGGGISNDAVFVRSRFCRLPQILKQHLAPTHSFCQEARCFEVQDPPAVLLLHRGAQPPRPSFLHTVIGHDTNHTTKMCTHTHSGHYSKRPFFIFLPILTHAVAREGKGGGQEADPSQYRRPCHIPIDSDVCHQPDGE